MQSKTCARCGAIFSPTFKRNGKLVKDGRRKYCFSCSPKKAASSVERTCDVCAKVYYGPTLKCSACIKAIARRKSKQWLVDLKGGSCVLCGYTQCLAALCFHHVVPGTKKFNLNATTVTWRISGEVKKELAKCVLLCMNCHMELHAGVKTLTGNTLALIQEKRALCASTEKRVQPSKLRITDCSYCGNEFVRTNREKYCSPPCAQQASRRTRRPSKKVLKKLVWAQPVSTVARKFKVSGNAVHKWCKQYGIKTPPRGYWQKKNATSRPTKAKLKKLLWAVPTSRLAEQYGVSATTVARWCRQYGLEKPGPGYWRKQETTPALNN